MQHPRLNLGLVGFTAEQRTQVERFLALQATFTGKQAPKRGESTGPIPWQITDYREANALLLSTQHASLDDHHIVRFPADLKHSDVVGVRPSELRIPYALVGDASQSIQAVMATDAPRIDLADAVSIKNALGTFEAALHAVRSLFAMAQLLQARGGEIDDRHTFHVVRRGLLEAVVDVAQQRVMMRNVLQPTALEDAYWLSRPLSANTLPPGFTQWSMAELAWIYAQHSISVNLPKRFLTLPIYLHHSPKVRPWMIYPRQMELLELLGQEPCSYPRLAQAFPAHPDLLQRDLCVLLACRAITTTPPKQPDMQTDSFKSPADAQVYLETAMHPNSNLPFQLKTMRAGLY
jgi:hypothetical protein